MTSKANPMYLPLPLTPLIGRESELGAIQSYYERTNCRLVTLTGAAGAGKTRLALELAARVQNEFPEGVAFVPLARVAEPGLVADTIAASLGVSVIPGRSPIEWLTDYLSDRRLLLILDNFEHVLLAAPLISQLLSGCPRLTLLVTSRAPLRIAGEQEFLVVPLAVPTRGRTYPLGDLAAIESVALFCHRAAAIRPGFTLTEDNAAAISGICARLDGLPLAIELAAARLRVLSTQALLAKLEPRLPLLTDGSRGNPLRHQSLRDAIAWSVNLLPEPEQRLFARLGLFGGGSTLDDAAAVCNPEQELGVSTLDGLSHLVEASLLIHEERQGIHERDWFTMLETVREYARELFERSSDAEMVRSRMVSDVVSFAERTDEALRGVGAATWMPYAESRLTDVRTVLNWARERNDTQTVLAITAGMALYWHETGRYLEGEPQLLAGLAMAGADSPTYRRAQALFALGCWQIWKGAVPAARSPFEEAICLFRTMGSSSRQLALCLAWYAMSRSDDREAAFAAAHEAEYLSSSPDDLINRGRVLYLSSYAYMAHGEFGRARVMLNESLCIYESIGDQTSLMYVMISWASLEEQAGNHQSAGIWYEKTLAIARSLCSPSMESWALRGLGHTALANGDPRRSCRLFAESLPLAREIGNYQYIANAFAGVSSAALRLGSLHEAVQIAAAADALWKRLGNNLRQGVLEALIAEATQASISFERDMLREASSRGLSLSLDQAIAAVNIFVDGLSVSASERETRSAIGALSRRETEVLRHIALGLSNAEIAALLVLSIRTVERHILNIYSKLGVRGSGARAAAIAFAREHSIVVQ